MIIPVVYIIASFDGPYLEEAHVNQKNRKRYKPLNIPVVVYQVYHHPTNAPVLVLLPEYLKIIRAVSISELVAGHPFSRTRVRRGRVRRRAGVSCPQLPKMLKDPPVPMPARFQSLPSCARSLWPPFTLHFPNASTLLLLCLPKTKSRKSWLPISRSLLLSSKSADDGSGHGSGAAAPDCCGRCWCGCC